MANVADSVFTEAAAHGCVICAQPAAGLSCLVWVKPDDEPLAVRSRNLLREEIHVPVWNCERHKDLSLRPAEHHATVPPQ